MTGARADRDVERGAALLVAIVSVAVLTAIAVNLAYESRVSLQIAANARDALRAEYLARSGVTFSRLVLSFQQELDGPAAAAPGAVPVPRLQIWRALPVGSELARALFPTAGASPEAAARPESGFEAAVDDEGRKVNAQLDMLSEAASAAKAAAQVQALYEVICDPRWDPLFDREDERGVRTSREELLQRLRDWVDVGEVASALNADFRSGSCGTTVLSPPWADSYGDENQPYDRGEDRYRVKNARMDSLDELLLVAGVGDAFMAAFQDALTVYVPRDAKQNVNELDRERLVTLARRVADPPAQQTLLDPAFGDLLQKLVFERTLGGILALAPTQLGKLVEAAGVSVNANLLQGQNSPFTDRSTTFRIRSTGRAGAVEGTIDAVIWMTKAQAGEPVGAPGRLVYWREE